MLAEVISSLMRLVKTQSSGLVDSNRPAVRKDSALRNKKSREKTQSYNNQAETYRVMRRRQVTTQIEKEKKKPATYAGVNEQVVEKKPRGSSPESPSMIF